MSNEEPSAEEQKAATKVQAISRGRSGRKEAKKQAEEEAKQKKKEEQLAKKKEKAKAKMSSTAKIADGDGDGVIDLNEALTYLRSQSLQHEKVQQLRMGAPMGSEQNLALDGTEPPVNTRAEMKEWRIWAIDQAKRNADTSHPRMQVKGGAPKPLPFRAMPNDVLEQVGIVPCLYLDFLKFGAGYCLLGALLGETTTSCRRRYYHFAVLSRIYSPFCHPTLA